MMIDTHCHFDMMSNPEAYIHQKEEEGDFVIGMTNLPSHFQMGKPQITHYKHIRIALGFHPLLAAENQTELPLFKKLVEQTSYIGEIGLDFSRSGLATKKEQTHVLEEVLAAISGKKKIISVHSRRAEKELLGLLDKYKIENVVFHWYSGSVGLIPAILERGYFFSVNEAMCLSSNGLAIIRKIPNERILTETDAPYNSMCNIKKVLGCLDMTERDIYNNFNRLLESLKEV